jgi:hypothetical protein
VLVGIDQRIKRRRIDQPLFEVRRNRLMAVIMLGRSHSDPDRYFGVLDGQEESTP